MNALCSRFDYNMLTKNARLQRIRKPVLRLYNDLFFIIYIKYEYIYVIITSDEVY